MDMLSSSSQAMPDESPHELQDLTQRLAFAERLLAGIAQANDSLLNVTDYRKSIQSALSILGKSTRVDRVYLFRCHEDQATQQLLASQKWEWVAEGIAPEIDNPELQSFPLEALFPRWSAELPQGKHIAGLIRDFPASEQEILETQNILSMVVVPIAVRTTFWGFMGFDDCHQGHVWSSSEVDALKTVANSFGGAFARREAETQLQQVNDSLEARIQQRTAELEASAALANSANRAKSDFLANMSHELRTPLNGILGYAQILQRSEELKSQEKAHASVIEQCGQHLLTLINDILDLSKIESQKMSLYPSELDFSSFMQAIIEMFSIQANQKGIIFRYNLSSLLPTGIWIDKKRLMQVLFNLISNAIKFTDRGEVEVRVTGQPSIGKTDQASRQQYYLQFEVHDTGPGISPKDLRQIFTPFEQVGNIEKRSKGTGLGLAISQKIVEMMGGELNVNSVLGQGSCFSFAICCPEVKLESRSALEPSTRKVLAYQGETKSILVVDDRWENRAVLTNMLAPLGFQMFEAESGEQGLEKATATKPDLIITDLVMPIMDGYEFIRLLRQHKSTHQTKIFASSASVFQSDQQKSLDAGGDCFISKPVHLRELLQALQSNLNLEWIYEKKVLRQAQAVDRGALEIHLSSSPPLETLRDLQKLALSGLIKAFRNELDRLDQTSTKYQRFTQKYRTLAASFQLKSIQSSLEQAIAEYLPEVSETEYL